MLRKTDPATTTAELPHSALALVGCCASCHCGTEWRVPLPMRILLSLVAGLAGCTLTTDESGSRAAINQQRSLASIRAEIESAYAKRMRAYQTKDLATLVGQISPDFSASLPDGKTLGKTELAGYIERNLQRFVRINSQSNDIEALRVENGVVVADVRQRLARIQIVDGKEALVESSVLQTETWVKVDGEWQLRSVGNEREQTLTVDGRPVGGR